MIATMNESGTLTIKPETPIEAFALKKWSESYDVGKDDQADSRSFLLIDANLPSPEEG